MLLLPGVARERERERERERLVSARCARGARWSGDQLRGRPPVSQSMAGGRLGCFALARLGGAGSPDVALVREYTARDVVLRFPAAAGASSPVVSGFSSPMVVVQRTLFFVQTFLGIPPPRFGSDQIQCTNSGWALACHRRDDNACARAEARRPRDRASSRRRESRGRPAAPSALTPSSCDRRATGSRERAGYRGCNEHSRGRGNRSFSPARPPRGGTEFLQTPRGAPRRGVTLTH